MIKVELKGLDPDKRRKLAKKSFKYHIYWKKRNVLLCIKNNIRLEEAMSFLTLLNSCLINTRKEFNSFNFDNCDYFYRISDDREVRNIRKIKTLEKDIGEVNSNTTLSHDLRYVLSRLERFVRPNEQEFPVIRLIYLFSIFISYEGDYTSKNIKKTLKQLDEIVRGNQDLKFFEEKLKYFEQLEIEDDKKQIKYNYIGCMNLDEIVDNQKQVSLFHVLNHTNYREGEKLDLENLVYYYPTHIFSSFDDVLKNLRMDVEHYIIIAHDSDKTGIEVTLNSDHSNANLEINYLKMFFDRIDSKKTTKNVLLLDCTFNSEIQDLVSNYNLNVIYFIGNVSYLSIDIFCTIYLISLRKGFSEDKAFDFAKEFSHWIYFPFNGTGWKRIPSSFA